VSLDFPNDSGVSARKRRHERGDFPGLIHFLERVSSYDLGPFDVAHYRMREEEMIIHEVFFQRRIDF
jgi:hypothetical protein